MLKYEIIANATEGREATIVANETIMNFDASSGRDDVLPNPAELLLSSMAACILKNIQRYSEMLHITYRKAEVTITGERNNNPPYMSKINYSVKIDSDEDAKKINTLHKNIIKFGTITNTLSRACKVTGTMDLIK